MDEENPDTKPNPKPLDAIDIALLKSYVRFFSQFI